MKSKYQLIILNVLITIISIYFTYAVFEEYKQSQKVKVNNYIEKTVMRNEKIIKNTFKKIKDEIEQDRDLFKEIHTIYTKKLRKNKTLDIFKLKEEISKNYDLNNKEVELFLIDKNYTVINSTYKADIGFKLADVPDARVELDKSKDGKIHQSKSVSIDIINSEIKSYSYSKINNDLYFEMGFINKNIHNSLKLTMSKVKLLTDNRSNLFRIEERLDGTEYYDNILNKNTAKTKEEYLSSKKKFLKNEKTNDFVILSNRSGKKLKKYLDDGLIVYIPLIKKDNKYLELVGDFVLKLYIDRSYEKKLSAKVEKYFQIFLIFHIFFLLVIYYFTKKYHDAQIKLKNKLEENQKLFDENKDFISSMTEQIQTPLSVIMNNYAFIEKNVDTNLKKYDEQINSSINMLKNSYEDLTYIVNNEKLEYPMSKVNLSQFVKQRVSYFNIVAKSQGCVILSSVEDNIFISINETELERLIDNNLSNAIKYGKKSFEINVNLVKKESEICLEFFSYSDEIKNKEKIFIRNYQEKSDSKKSLGLGLSMVKSICEKYNITYEVIYVKKQNIFIYKFK